MHMSQYAWHVIVMSQHHVICIYLHNTQNFVSCRQDVGLLSSYFLIIEMIQISSGQQMFVIKQMG